MAFDPLAQLHSMPAEPKLEEAQEKERDNESYKAETMPNFEGARKKLAMELYGQNKTIENNSDDVLAKEQWPSFANYESGSSLSHGIENQGETNIDSALEAEQPIELWELVNSPLFPTLRGLMESGNIDYEIYKKTVEQLKKTKKEEAQDIIISIINSIWNNDTKETMLKQLNSKEEINEDNFEQTPFYTDAKTRLELDKWVWWLEIMLAQNYIQIPENSWKTNPEQDLATTLDTVLNKILEKNSPDFAKQNAIHIGQVRNSSSLSERYSALKQVYKEDLKTDAIIWGKKWKEEVTRKKDSLKAKAEKITKQIIEAKNITDVQEKEQRLLELKIEKEKIIKEWNEVDVLEWELFVWNKQIEDPEQKNPETPKQAA